MSRVNQAGAPIEEHTLLFPEDFKEGEVAQAVLLILGRAGLELVRTNATKHGNTELELRKAS
jgi:hypothetical protein